MDNKYQIWIKNNESSFWFPVNPSKISISNGSENETVSIDGLGKSTILKSPALTSISFSSQLPASYFPQCNYNDILDPLDSYDKIKTMKENGAVRLIVTNSDINLECTIEDFSRSESAGDVGTLDFSISLTEYREPSVRRITVVSNKATLSDTNVVKRADTRVKSETYTVVSGDYLGKISKKLLGSTSRWREFYTLNKETIGSNPNKIYPGQVLKVPS